MGAEGDTEQGDVLDLLSRLVEKSLVVAEATGGGGVRYRMLEPIRQYAREKLEEGGEAEEVRRRHASFFLALAEEAEPRLRGAGGHGVARALGGRARQHEGGALLGAGARRGRAGTYGWREHCGDSGKREGTTARGEVAGEGVGEREGVRRRRRGQRRWKDSAG